VCAGCQEKTVLPRFLFIEKAYHSLVSLSESDWCKEGT